MPDTEYHVLLKWEERNSIPYPSYHGADMQNVKFCTQAYFQTKIFTREKYEKPLINTSFMLIFLTTHYLPIILPQYIIQIVSVFSWFTLISPNLRKTFYLKLQHFLQALLATFWKSVKTVFLEQPLKHVKQLRLVFISKAYFTHGWFHPGWRMTPKKLSYFFLGLNLYFSKYKYWRVTANLYVSIKGQKRS